MCLTEAVIAIGRRRFPMRCCYVTSVCVCARGKWLHRTGQWIQHLQSTWQLFGNTPRHRYCPDSIHSIPMSWFYSALLRVNSAMSVCCGPLSSTSELRISLQRCTLASSVHWQVHSLVYSSVEIVSRLVLIVIIE